MKSNTINLILTGIGQSSILLCFLLLSSCSGGEVGRVLSRADELMWSSPDSALVILESIDTSAMSVRSQKARYSLLYSMALDRNNIKTTDTRTIMPAVKYYECHGTPDERLKTLFYLGRMQANAEEYDKAVVTLSKALEYSDDVSDIKMLGFTYSEIAYSYSQTKNFFESRLYYGMAESCFDRAGEHRYSCMMVLNKANDCVSSVAWSEADSLFNSIIADDSFPSDLKADALSTYGRMLTICPFSDYNKAVSMFERSMELLEDNHLRYVNDECVYAYALAKVGRMKEAKEIFAILDERGLSAVPVYRYCLSQVKKIEGNYSEAYSMLLESLRDTDAQILEIQSQSSAIAQKNYYKKLSLEKERDVLQYRLWMVILMTISGLIIVCVTVVLYKRYAKAENERRRLLILKDAVDRKLIESNKSADVRLRDMEILQSEYLKLYRNQCQWMFPFVDILYDPKKKIARRNALRSEVSERITYLLGGINSEDSKGQLEFESELNRVYDNVMRKFRAEFKDWKESDIRLFSCVVAQFDAVLILRIFNLQSKESVYMRKVRLKEKIRHSDSQEKDRFLLFF